MVNFNIRDFNKEMPHHAGDTIRAKWYEGLEVAFVPKGMCGGYLTGRVIGHIYTSVLHIAMETGQEIFISTIRCCPLDRIPQEIPKEREKEPEFDGARMYEAWHNLSRSQQLEHLYRMSKAEEEGKTIQMFDEDDWYDLHEPVFDRRNLYRIKPEPPQKKIVPLDFTDILDIKDRWILEKNSNIRCYIEGFIDKDHDALRLIYEKFNLIIDFEELQKKYTRLDGSRFEKEIEV